MRFAARIAPASRPVRRAERSIRLLSLLIVLGMRAVAQATPPDPLWLSGIYDGADFDDAIQPLAALVLVQAPVLAITPLGPGPGSVIPPAPRAPRQAALPVARSRAPPAR
jgi:hypothetical protein